MGVQIKPTGRNITSPISLAADVELIREEAASFGILIRGVYDTIRTFFALNRRVNERTMAFC